MAHKISNVTVCIVYDENMNSTNPTKLLVNFRVTLRNLLTTRSRNVKVDKEERVRVGLCLSTGFILPISKGFSALSFSL